MNSRAALIFAPIFVFVALTGDTTSAFGAPSCGQIVRDQMERIAWMFSKENRLGIPRGGRKVDLSIDARDLALWRLSQKSGGVETGYVQVLRSDGTSFVESGDRVGEKTQIDMSDFWINTEEVLRSRPKDAESIAWVRAVHLHPYPVLVPSGSPSQFSLNDRLNASAVVNRLRLAGATQAVFEFSIIYSDDYDARRGEAGVKKLSYVVDQGMTPVP